MAASAGVQADAAAVQARGAGVSTLRSFAILSGAVLWLISFLYLWSSGGELSLDRRAWTCLLPPLAWGLPLAASLLREGRAAQALCILIMFPSLVLGTGAALAFADALWTAVPPYGEPGMADINALRRMVLALILGAGWFELAQARHRWLFAPSGDELRGLRKGIGVAEVLLVIILLAVATAVITPFPNDGYSVRSRVSELILAGSSAKTALSEGMQTYGSWSPEWMSAITISATGMISSAHIGPQGQITVYGTAPTSGSAVTMTPTITTDNKLVWSCTGSPVKYMPASCR